MGTMIAACSIGWLVGPTFAGVLADAGGSRMHDQRVDRRRVAAAVALIALAWALPAARASATALVAFLVLSGIGRAVLNTLVFVLAASGRHGAASACGRSPHGRLRARCSTRGGSRPDRRPARRRVAHR